MQFFKKISSVKLFNSSNFKFCTSILLFSIFSRFQLKMNFFQNNKIVSNKSWLSTLRGATLPRDTEETGKDTSSPDFFL